MGPQQHTAKRASFAPPSVHSRIIPTDVLGDPSLHRDTDGPGRWPWLTMPCVHWWDSHSNGRDIQKSQLFKCNCENVLPEKVKPFCCPEGGGEACVGGRSTSMRPESFTLATGVRISPGNTFWGFLFFFLGISIF